MAIDVTGLLAEALTGPDEATGVPGLLAEVLTVPLPTGIQTRELLVETLGSGEEVIGVPSLLVEVLCSPPLEWLTESQSIYDRIRKHIPEERVGPAEPLLRAAAMVLYEVRAATRRLMDESSRRQSSEAWLRLYGESQGVPMLVGETVEAYRARLVEFGNKVTRPSVESVIESLGIPPEDYELIEWWQACPSVQANDVDDVNYGFYVGVSRMPMYGGFTLVLPIGIDVQLGARVIGAINRTRALGIPWIIILEEFLGSTS